MRKTNELEFSLPCPGMWIQSEKPRHPGTDSNSGRGCILTRRLRALSAFLLMGFCLFLPIVSKAGDTNGILPSVGVQVVQDAAISGALPGIFTIQRTGDTGQPLVVNYRVSGTATNGVDYARLSGAVTIPAGQLSSQIEVAPVNRQQEGNSKRVTLTLVARNQPFTLVTLRTPSITAGRSTAPRGIFSRRKPNGLWTTRMN